MKQVIIKFKRELTQQEKKQLMDRFQGCYFNLSECLQNGLPQVYITFTNLRNIVKYYKPLGCEFELCQ